MFFRNIVVGSGMTTPKCATRSRIVFWIGHYNPLLCFRWNNLKYTSKFDNAFWIGHSSLMHSKLPTSKIKKKNPNQPYTTSIGDVLTLSKNYQND